MKKPIKINKLTYHNKVISTSSLVKPKGMCRYNTFMDYAIAIYGDRVNLSSVDNYYEQYHREIMQHAKEIFGYSVGLPIITQLGEIELQQLAITVQISRLDYDVYINLCSNLGDKVRLLSLKNCCEPMNDCCEKTINLEPYFSSIFPKKIAIEKGQYLELEFLGGILLIEDIYVSYSIVNHKKDD
jgi:hypothetical protein